MRPTFNNSLIVWLAWDSATHLSKVLSASPVSWASLAIAMPSGMSFATSHAANATPAFKIWIRIADHLLPLRISPLSHKRGMNHNNHCPNLNLNWVINAASAIPVFPFMSWIWYALSPLRLSSLRQNRGMSHTTYCHYIYLQVIKALWAIPLIATTYISKS